MPPKGRNTALELYIKKVRTDVTKRLKKLQAHKLRDNLTSEERLALPDLRQRDDIITKPADKGSAVVI